MPFQQATLIEKSEISEDIYLLKYKAEWIELISGQFITFILPEIWGRAYSVLKNDAISFTLIIKRWSREIWGRGWSIALCDMEIWTELSFVWPAGHFVLSEETCPRCFLGTWTGFVPLFHQINTLLNRGDNSPIFLAFWVRNKKNMFFERELESLSQRYSNFSFTLFLSREEVAWYQKWYVTDILNEKFIEKYHEFYLCWAPGVIQWSKKILRDLWVLDENVFFEKY